MSGIFKTGLASLLLFHLVCNAKAAAVDQGQGSNNDTQSVQQDEPDLLVTSLVYMDIQIGDDPPERIIFGLFENIAPKTCHNFRSLILGNQKAADGTRLAYNGSIFHRTIKNFMIQGGDFTLANGWGGLSVYGKYFPDENFVIKHYGAGWLGMANAGPDTNGSQFYITCVLTQWLDNGHTLFGIVIDGMSVVRKIENNPTYSNDRPIREVRIVNCGVQDIAQTFTVPRAPVAG